MKKKDFIGELLSYGTVFALGFLVVVGAAIMFVGFLCVVAVSAFFNRVMN